MSTNQIDETEVPDPHKRQQVKIACRACQASHCKCDNERPCGRCKANNTAHLCVDVEPKKRGRKRKATATKRSRRKPREHESSEESEDCDDVQEEETTQQAAAHSTKWPLQLHKPLQQKPSLKAPKIGPPTHEEEKNKEAGGEEELSVSLPPEPAFSSSPFQWGPSQPQRSDFFSETPCSASSALVISPSTSPFQHFPIMVDASIQTFELCASPKCKPGDSSRTSPVMGPYETIAALNREIEQLQRELAAARAEARENLASKFNALAYAQTYEQTQVPICYLSVPGHMLGWNRALRDLLMFAESDLGSKVMTWRDILHPDYHRSMMRTFLSALSKHQRSFKMRSTFFTKAGFTIEATIMVTIVVSEQDRPLYCVVHVLDASVPTFEQPTVLQTERVCV